MSYIADKKGVGFCHNENFHFLDHVGVICNIMEIPILVVGDLNETLAKKYYRDLKVQNIDFEDLTIDFLFSNYDVFFLSEYWDLATYLRQTEEQREKYGKTPRVVHCPHGFSDKSYYLDKCVLEDIVLVYGNRMLEMFKKLGTLDQLNSYVITGNYRYAYYRKNKAFYDQIIQNEIRSKFKKEQPTLLYAPTWQDSFQASTFFEACGPLIEELPSDYNMIVKLHPSLERHDIVEYTLILNTYEEKENVVFICEFPPIYPLLDFSDIYIGDTSSIGYDYLAINKPMFFLNKFKESPEKNDRVYLYRCGTNIFPEDYRKIYSIIEKELPKDEEKFGKIRREVNLETFGEDKPLERIKEEIIQAYNSEREN